MLFISVVVLIVIKQLDFGDLDFGTAAYFFICFVDGGEKNAPSVLFMLMVLDIPPVTLNVSVSREHISDKIQCFCFAPLKKHLLT